MPTLERMTDDQLMAELRAGRPAALEELYRRYAKKLHVYFAAGARAAQPEDLVHDVFLRVVEVPEQYDPDRAPFHAWLFGIARHRGVDVLRREGRRRSAAIDEAPEVGVEDSTGAALEGEELTVAVRDCLDELKKDEEREALVLYYLGQKLFREIGELVGKSTSMAQKLVHAAREKVRGCLERKGVEP